MTEKQFEEMINELKQNSEYPQRKNYRLAYDNLLTSLMVDKDFEKIERLKFGWYERYREFNIEKSDEERISEYIKGNSVRKLIRK